MTYTEGRGDFRRERGDGRHAQGGTLKRERERGAQCTVGWGGGVT